MDIHGSTESQKFPVVFISAAFHTCGTVQGIIWVWCVAYELLVLTPHMCMYMCIESVSNYVLKLSLIHI